MARAGSTAAAAETSTPGAAERPAETGTGRRSATTTRASAHRIPGNAERPVVKAAGPGRSRTTAPEPAPPLGGGRRAEAPVRAGWAVPNGLEGPGGGRATHEEKMASRFLIAVATAMLLVAPGCFSGWEWTNPCDNARTRSDGSICGEALIRAGSFTMGSPRGETNRGSDETHHRVTLTRSFYLWKHETTQEEFKALMGYNPSAFSSCGEVCPVERVSWHEALAYCNALSKQAGLDQCFDCHGTRSSATCSLKSAYAGNGGSDYYKCPGYRLPTESEWEYAARAGTTGATYGNLEQIAWFDGNSERKTHAGGAKKPNAWGLHDMIGNVWEWNYDWYGPYPDGSLTDPVGPSSGTYRVIRGGGWSFLAKVCRAAYREGIRPALRHDHLGFRPARSGP